MTDRDIMMVLLGAGIAIVSMIVAKFFIWFIDRK